MSQRKPVTSLWHPPEAKPEEKTEPATHYDSSKARKPSKDHPWHKQRLSYRRRDYNVLDDVVWNTMMAEAKLIVRGLQKDPLYEADMHRWVNKYNKVTECIRVRIKGKVYMLDKYLPEIARKLCALLEAHHWKFQGSSQKLLGMMYFISPDWDYWIEVDRKRRLELYENRQG